MPDGERVTTGSEPNTERLAAALMRLRHEQFICKDGLRGGVHTADWRNLGDRHQQEWIAAAKRFQELVVEPGHDEQTEACRVCGGRGWHTAGGNDPAACGACAAGEAWYGGDEWQPDLRTVAAVVEFLRNRAASIMSQTERLIVLGTARKVEERFKPSAPGGGRQGGRST